MEIIQFEYKDKLTLEGPISLCLGYFDSLHLGHIAMIKKALQSGNKVAVMTFDTSPKYVLGLRDEASVISSLSDKADFLEELGVDYLLILHFDQEVASLDYEVFINDILMNINPSIIYCGEDYRFGYCAFGDVNILKEHFNVEVIPLIKLNNKKISSRDIISHIQNGKITEANELLGRPYRMCGNVSRGLGNGAKLGFATANLDLDYPYVLPKEGVYMGYTYVNDTKYKAIICVGKHPTIQELNKPIVEVHLLDFNDNLYGKFLYVEFIKFIRGVKKFDSLDELVSQIQKDAQSAKKELKL